MFLSHPWRSWVHQWACQGLQLTQDARDTACKQSITWLRPQWSVSHHTGPAGVQGLHISRAAVFWPSGPVIDSMVVAVRGWAAQTLCIPMAHFCHPSLPLLAPEGLGRSFSVNAQAEMLSSVVPNGPERTGPSPFLGDWEIHWSLLTAVVWQCS